MQRTYEHMRCGCCKLTRDRGFSLAVFYVHHHGISSLQVYPLHQSSLAAHPLVCHLKPGDNKQHKSSSHAAEIELILNPAIHISTYMANSHEIVQMNDAHFLILMNASNVYLVP